MNNWRVPVYFPPSDNDPMNQRQSLVVLSGAGMSAESGIATFRGSDGLWEGHRVEEVASSEGFAANPELVLDFYNQRRRQVVAASPNEGHHALARLERIFDVHVVTQNVDDLHERGGSTNVMHLHGEIRKARSMADETLVVPIEGTELNVGDCGPDGAQLRPHIVWFGEAVPLIESAIDVVSQADVLVVVDAAGGSCVVPRLHSHLRLLGLIHTSDSLN